MAQFFIDETGLSIGESKWNIRNIAKNKPFKIIASTHFDKKVQYSVVDRGNALFSELSGIYNLNTHSNYLSINLNNLRVNNNNFKFATNKLQLTIKNKSALNFEDSPLSLAFESPRIQFQLKGVLIESSLRGKSDLRINKGILILSLPKLPIFSMKFATRE